LGTRSFRSHLSAEGRVWRKKRQRDLVWRLATSGKRRDVLEYTRLEVIIGQTSGRGNNEMDWGRRLQKPEKKSEFRLHTGVRLEKMGKSIPLHGEVKGFK